MKRPEQHVMEDESEAVLGSLLPREWITRRLPKDYGVDLEVELVDQGVVTGNRIWIQMKSVKHTRRASVSYHVGDQFPELATDSAGNLNVEYVLYPMLTKELEYSLHCPFPLLFFLADLHLREVYWLPLQDEVIANLSQINHNWGRQKTATLRIPLWNRLSMERSANFPAMRWYALEPARMYAFAKLHYYHHEFQYTGRLSGYEIGNGWIDRGEEHELRHSLQSAHSFIDASLDLDVLFGENGIDYFRLKALPGLNVPGIAHQLREALIATSQAIERLDSRSYTFHEMALLIGKVGHAIDLLSTAIASYQGFRAKYLLTDEAAVWRAASQLTGLEGPPVVPMSRQPRQRSSGKRGA